MVVKVESKDRLLEVFEVAKRNNLPVSLIADRGLTELKPGTLTCVGIGPAPEKLIDRITGSMSLL